MNKGHLDARYYRFDFAKVVIDEMILATGGKVPISEEEENEAKLKEFFK